MFEYNEELQRKILRCITNSDEPISLDELLEHFKDERASLVYAIVRRITERQMVKFDRDMKLVINNEHSS